jgi:hypothetical protein
MQSARNRVGQLDGAVLADSAAWGIPALVARLLLILPPIAAVALILTVPHPRIYHFLIEEDHVIEWAQFAAILGASAVFALVGRPAQQAGRRRLAVLFLLVAVGAFVVAGEEISWGQRILGLATPAALAEINHQGETNIHNISALQRVFNVGELLVGLYGFGVPLLWANRAARDRLRRESSPRLARRYSRSARRLLRPVGHSVDLRRRPRLPAGGCSMPRAGFSVQIPSFTAQLKHALRELIAFRLCPSPQPVPRFGDEATHCRVVFRLPQLLPSPDRTC